MNKAYSLLYSYSSFLADLDPRKRHKQEMIDLSIMLSLLYLASINWDLMQSNCLGYQVFLAAVHADAEWLPELHLWSFLHWKQKLATQSEQCLRIINGKKEKDCNIVVAYFNLKSCTQLPTLCYFLRKDSTIGVD